MNMYLILNGYLDRGVWNARSESFRFLFGGLDEEWRLQKRAGHTWQIAPLQFGCCCPHKEMQCELQQISYLNIQVTVNNKTKSM